MNVIKNLIVESDSTVQMQHGFSLNGGVRLDYKEIMWGAHEKKGKNVIKMSRGKVVVWRLSQLQSCQKWRGGWEEMADREAVNKVSYCRLQHVCVGFSFQTVLGFQCSSLPAVVPQSVTLLANLRNLNKGFSPSLYHQSKPLPESEWVELKTFCSHW